MITIKNYFKVPGALALLLVSCSVDAEQVLANENNKSVEQNRTIEETLDEQRMKPDEQQVSEIKKLFEKYDRVDVPGCAVAVYQNGETLFSGAFGSANLDYFGIPLSDSSAFYMASVSKQVTAAAAGLLIVRGELDPEARVSGYLEKWPEWAEGVRVKHLFNHTSGLPDIYDIMNIAGISLSNVMDLDDYMSLIYNGESLKNRPGSRYNYTNSGYTVLARLVEEISGDDFSVFVDNEILQPLNMKATHFHDNRYRVIPNRAIGYAPVAVEDNEDNGSSDDGNSDDNGPDPAPQFRQAYLSNFQGVGPGGLYSTLKDWKHWEAYWSGHKALPGEFEELKTLMTRREIVSRDTLDYGMGLEIKKWHNLRIEGHSGNFMGYKTDVRRFPDHGLAMLTICNREDANPVRKNRELARILLKEQFEVYLKPFEGTYHNDELQVDFEITIKDASLNLKRRLNPNGTMTEDAKDIWRAGSWEFVFLRDDDDAVKGFLVSTGRAREVEFLRK